MHKSFLDFFPCLWYSTHYLQVLAKPRAIPDLMRFYL